MRAFLRSSRLTPKVRVLLDFLDEYLGTDRDPRLKNDLAKGYFTDRMLPQTSGPENANLRHDFRIHGH